MHNMKKILFSLFCFIFLISGVSASIAEGDSVKVENKDGHWIVKDISEKYQCDLNGKKSENVISAESSYEPSYGFTYENTCTELGEKTLTTCIDLDTICTNKKTSSSISSNNTTKISTDGEDFSLIKLLESNTSNITNSSKTDINLNVITDGAAKDNEYEEEPGEEDPGDKGSQDNAEFECKEFVDYYTVTGTVTYYLATSYYCPEECKQIVDGDETCTCSKRPLNCTKYTDDFSYKIGDEDCKSTSATSGEARSTAYGKAKLSHESSSGCTSAYISNSSVTPHYKYENTTTVTYCKKSEPTKVETYTYKLVIHSSKSENEAYCINPSYSFNTSFAWDYTFKSSKCYDSLHTYNYSTNKLELSTDCGYVYIIAEAKRINAESIKNGGEEIFNYSSIVTAMRLFGTGITSDEFNIYNDTKTMFEKLSKAGYYYKYKGWNDYYSKYNNDINKQQYIAIPSIIPAKSSNYPSLYRFWMPEFYSIYINTAMNAASYLKDNIRFNDVGNVACNNKNLCSTYPDGESYIVDTEYYLNHLACVNPDTCTSGSKIDSSPTSNQDLADIPNTLGIYDEDNNVSNSKQDGNDISNFIKEDAAVESNCSGGLGILCGLENDIITGTYIDNSGNVPSGTSSKKLKEMTSDYLDAIYLYIRALQGNKISYEKDVQDLITQRSPIDGQTSVIVNDNEYVTLKYKISEEYIKSSDYEEECESGDISCKANIFVYDSNYDLIDNFNSYDYCKKNFCYVKVKYTKVCSGGTKSSSLYSIVVTDSNIDVVKRIVPNGSERVQTLYVYDKENALIDDYCQDINALSEKIEFNCPCDPKEKSNKVEANGNIKDTNYCSSNYNTFDELYYGDPSMSTILNACYDEDKLKYDYTVDLNINGNDLVHEGEVETNKYGYQMKSDDFDVCKLYCRQESRAYLANKTTVRAGMALKYDIGQSLVDKKIVNEKVNNIDNFSPIVILEYQECTSVFDYDKWKTLYDKSTTDREKNQLLYSAYNCNLYSTSDIPRDITGDKSDEKYYPTGKEYTNFNSYLYDYAEPAMIEYSYDTSTGKTTIVKNYGTTKDYLLSQELSLDYINYVINNYDDTYLDELGVKIDNNYGSIDSNLNNTVYCSGESCYKIKGSDGKYYYNPNAKSSYDYTVVTSYDNNTESGNILSYSDWGLHYNDEEYSSKTVTYKGHVVPTNTYSSFIVVNGIEFHNDAVYFSDSYTGVISRNDDDNNDVSTKEDSNSLSKSKVKLDKNIFPLHLSKKTGTYNFESTVSNFKSTYNRNSYYTKNGYELYEKLNVESAPMKFKYICKYDVYNLNDHDTDSGSGSEDNDNDMGTEGYVYRIVDLDDVFASVTDGKRSYPENWSSSYAQNVLTSIQNSYDNILEPENNNDSDLSYLEYSYTLTKEGIKKLRQYNDSVESSGGYLNDTLYDCEYDSEEEIFYNCKSSFLEETIVRDSAYSGDDLIVDNKTGTLNKGESEFCSYINNANLDACKYQKKGYVTIGGDN